MARTSGLANAVTHATKVRVNQTFPDSKTVFEVMQVGNRATVFWGVTNCCRQYPLT